MGYIKGGEQQTDGDESSDLTSSVLWQTDKKKPVKENKHSHRAEVVDEQDEFLTSDDEQNN